MKRFTLMLVLLLSFLQYGSAVEVEPVWPVKYQYRQGYKILSYVRLDAPASGKLKVLVDGVPISTVRTDRPDSLLVWLPMIGDSFNLRVMSGKRCLANQSVSAYIPSDWGYFNNGTIYVIQSSHQDIAWMDTPDNCRRDRVENIVLPAINMMKQNKGFKFEMEQTLNLMEALQDRPETRADLEKLYQENRFMWGATYNQPYEGLSSGEQLVRQAYYGRKWVLDHFPGCDDKVANNVDVPGRAWQMPQILAKSGIPYLFISRMGEGLYDWYSPDGSKVTAFSPGNYAWGGVWRFMNDDAATAFHRLHHRSQLWSAYYKEHHLPPLYAILISSDAIKPKDFQEVVDAWNLIADKSGYALPHMKVATAYEYFHDMDTPQSSIRKISGERPNLWLYIHGPAHYEATLFKRQAGVLLPAAEAFSTFALKAPADWNRYPRAVFDRAWMASIYPDHGLGGKNGEITDRIYEDSLRTARDLGQHLLHDALERIVTHVDAPTGSYVAFNDLTWKRSAIVSTAIKGTDAVVVDEDNHKVPSQIVTGDDGQRRVAFCAEDVPSMGYKTYRIKETHSKGSGKDKATCPTNFVENDFYKAVLGDGGIVSLYDKQLRKYIVRTDKFACGDVIETGYFGNGAGEFTSITDITRYDLSKLSSKPSQWRVTDKGALFTQFVNEIPTPHAIVRQCITFHHKVKKIDFDITLKNFDGAHNRQYRIAFPLNIINGNTVNYEVPMGVEQVGRDELNIIPGGWAVRGSYTHRPQDSHPREIQNFIGANGDGFGVTLTSCVAVADWIDPSADIASYPVLQGILLSTHKSCHGEGNWYDQKGTHSFHFSLMSHEQGWQAGYAAGVGENHQMYLVKKQNKGGEQPATYSYLSVSDPLTTLSVLKKCDYDNSVIIRLCEMEGKDKEISLTLPWEVKGVRRTNLIEQEGDDLHLSGKTLRLRLGHHAIETYKLLLE